MCVLLCFHRSPGRSLTPPTFLTPPPPPQVCVLESKAPQPLSGAVDSALQVIVTQPSPCPTPALSPQIPANTANQSQVRMKPRPCVDPESVPNMNVYLLSLFFPPESSCASSKRPTSDLFHQNRRPLLPHPPHPPRPGGGVSESSSSPTYAHGPPGGAAGRLRGRHQPGRLLLSPPPRSSPDSSLASLRHHKPASPAAAAATAASGHGCCSSRCCSSSTASSYCHRFSSSVSSSSSPYSHQGGEPAVGGGAAGDGVSGGEADGGGERRRRTQVVKMAATLPSHHTSLTLSLSLSVAPPGSSADLWPGRTRDTPHHRGEPAPRLYGAWGRRSAACQHGGVQGHAHG